MDNLVLLCSAHHRLLHHRAFRIVPEDDGLVFVSRHGEVIEPALRPQFPATFPPVFPGKRDRLDLDEIARFGTGRRRPVRAARY